MAVARLFNRGTEQRAVGLVHHSRLMLAITLRVGTVIALVRLTIFFGAVTLYGYANGFVQDQNSSLSSLHYWSSIEHTTSGSPNANWHVTRAII